MKRCKRVGKWAVSVALMEGLCVSAALSAQEKNQNLNDLLVRRLGFENSTAMGEYFATQAFGYSKSSITQSMARFESDIEKIRSDLRSTNASTREMAAHKTGDLPHALAVQLLPDLVETVRHSNNNIRMEVKFAVLKIGPEGVEALGRALQNPDKKLRYEISHLLEELALERVDTSRALPYLTNAVREEGKESPLRVSLSDAMERTGQAAIPYLQSLKGADSEFVSERPAARIRASIDIQSVMADLNSWDPVVRRSAITALGEQGAKALPALPTLIQNLSFSNAAGWDTPAVAEWAIEQIGAGAKWELVRSLNDPDLWVASRSAHLLGALGPQANDSVDSIVDFYQRRNENNYAMFGVVANAVEKSLKSIGTPHAQSAARRLEQTDRDYWREHDREIYERVKQESVENPEVFQAKLREIPEYRRIVAEAHQIQRCSERDCSQLNVPESKLLYVHNNVEFYWKDPIAETRTLREAIIYFQRQQYLSHLFHLWGAGGDIPEPRLWGF